MNGVHSRKRQRLKAILFLGGKCCVCGEVNALEFHHPDRKTIRYRIGEAIGNVCWETLKRELKKCELLCHDCHKEAHRGY